MEAKIKGIDNAGYWVIPEDGQYRVVVDFEARTVTIGLASNFIELIRFILLELVLVKM